MTIYKKFINKTYFKALGVILAIAGLISWILMHFEILSSEAAITGIISPILCLIPSTILQIISENTQSNEKLKIALERLTWRWKYRCKNEKGERVNGINSEGYDKEYKFITQNRGKSDKEIKKQMKNDKYWEEKFSIDARNMNITEEKALNFWIKDHFIY